MRLSEAILLGSIGSKQGFGHLSAYKGSKDKCAIGAALLATGNEAKNLPIAKLEETWPWTLTKDFVSPIELPAYIPICVSNTIWWLNDVEKWTRPQIAAWISSIEPAEVVIQEHAGIAENINLTVRPTSLTVKV